MTPKEQAERRLAEAQARLKAAQQGIALPTTAATAEQGTRRVSSRSPEDINLDDRPKGTWFNDLSVGVIDTITFGFADEGIAAVMTPFGKRTYEENLRITRSVFKDIEEDSPNAYLAGQIIGGFVPTSRLGAVAGVGKAGTANIRRAAVEGGIFGAAYGYGSSDSEELFSRDRVENAALNGVFGLGGGFIIGTALFQGGRLAKDGYQRLVQFRQGRSPRIDLDFKPVGSGARVADDVAEDLESIRRGLPGAPRTPSEPNAARSAVNRLTGRQSNELEPGAIASADDLILVPKKEVLFEKIAKLTPQQAKLAAKQLTDAMESGDLTKEPHFRSILGLDLSEFGDLEKVVPEVADILYELGEGILNKANLGKRTVKSFEARLRSRYGTNITEGQLDELTERVMASEGSATVGKIQMTLAGVQFARVAKDLMPRVLNGEKEARTVLAEELSKALRVSAKGQMLMSAAGRELGMLANSKSLLFREVADGVEAEDLATITQRVNEAMAKLDDDGLNELLARTRDLSQLEEISQVLLDPVHAEKVSAWFRARNTFEAFFKSTVLTPTTALVNFLSVPLHSWMRSDGARVLAEAALRASGDARTAAIVNMQRQAASAVRWEAHKVGVTAALQRVKWEALDSIRSIASVAGATKVAAKASASRQALIANGYTPPPIREFELRKRLAVTDTAGFNARLAERAQSEAPFATFVNALERAGATAANTLDALGTASARLFSGALDDYGRAAVVAKETYAEMAGQATAKALDEGLVGDALAKRVKELTERWATLPPRDILEEVERKLVNGEGLDADDLRLIRRDYNANKEAERVLFLDGPQTQVGRAGAAVADAADTVAGFGLFKGVLIPYISTPTRIMERGLGSYTPFGKFMDETKKALASTDPVVRAMEQARMDLGGTILAAGMVAAATGAITITNGADYRNSASLGGAPNMRVNFPGGGYVEFGRLDPLAMGLAMGGIIGQMWSAASESKERFGQDDAIATAMAVAYGGFRAAILDKSYLTGLNKLFEAVSSQQEGAFADYYAKYLPDAAARLVPFSGTFRQLNETITGRSLEAVSALDRIAKVIPGMGGYLPSRIDALGNEIESRTFGIAAGTTADEDDVTRQIRELGINITGLNKADPKGFDLTTEELSELRQIRANEALNSEGLTMKQALAVLLEDPSFQSLPDRKMAQDAVVEVMSQFNEPARELYESRNQTYLADRQAARSFTEYLKQGMMPEEARETALAEAQALGLEPTRTDALE